MVLAATPTQASSGQRRACSTSTIEIDRMALMQRSFVLSAPTLIGHFHACYAILQPPHTMRRVDVVLVVTPNYESSEQRRRCSTFTIENCFMAVMQGSFVLSAPTFMDHHHSLKAVLQALHTTRR